MTTPITGLEKATRVLLTILIISILLQFLAIYQTDYQLVSPLIGEDILLELITPNFFVAFITTIISLVCLILYFYKKYIMVLIIISTTLIWQQLYHAFWAFG